MGFRNKRESTFRSAGWYNLCVLWFHKGVILLMQNSERLDFHRCVSFSILKRKHINGYLLSMILKEVVARHNIRNVNFLERLILFLADNTGSILSAKTISNFLKSQKITMSVNTVMSYLNALTASFFLYKVNRYDIQGKKQFEINDKWQWFILFMFSG